jgi:DNA-binding response OmpR family regulator
MKPTLLIVDDEMLLRDVLHDYLSRQGYSVIQACNGAKAVEIARQHKVHLALVDIKMEGMSGLEVTVELKRIDPSMIVIIMTGYPSISTAITALKSGASEYIVKPFRLDELTRIIRKNLESLETEFENLQLKQRIRELEGKIDPEPKNDPEPVPSKPARSLDDAPRQQITVEEQAFITEKYRQNTRSAREQEIREKLERLEQMLSDGVIDREEFDRKKAELSESRYV